MKRVKLIYNSIAGGAHIAAQIDEIVALYQQNGYSLTPYRLTFKEDPIEIIGDMEQTYDHVLIAGGDGTVNYIVNMFKRNNIEIPIGILPAGTANDFASLLGMPRNTLKACRELIDGSVVEVDLGVVNGEYFVNVFSCGLMSDVSQKTPTLLKNTLGKLAYYLSGLAELSRFRKINVDIKTENGSYRDSSVIFFVFNGRTAGNFKLAHLAEVNDGLLDLVVVKGRNPFKTIGTLMHYFTLMERRKKYPEGIVHIQCSKIEIECQTDEVTDVDGQTGPKFPLTIECAKGALRVLVPQRMAETLRA